MADNFEKGSSLICLISAILLLISTSTSLADENVSYDLLIAINILNWLSLFVHVAVYIKTPLLTSQWRSFLLIIMNIVTILYVILNNLIFNNFENTIGIIIIGSILLFTSLFTFIVLYLLPLPSLSYNQSTVGTTSFQMIIKSENDNNNDNNNTDKRPVQCWFPINKTTKESIISSFFNKSILWTSGHPNSQLKESVCLLTQIAKVFKYPNFIFHHLTQCHTYSIWQNNFMLLNNNEILPVVNYSHGMYGWRQIHHSVYYYYHCCIDHNFSISIYITNI